MKKLKLYEELLDFRYSGEWIYFKINPVDSYTKLRIAIEKTGYSKLFYKTTERFNEDEEYNPIHTGPIYLVFNPKNEIPGRSQSEIKLDTKFIKKYKKLEYGGEIDVYDHEVEAEKYNL